MALVNGTRNNDILNGTFGDDIVNAKEGNDRILSYKAAVSPAGQYDELTGGAGADVFVMTDQYGNVGYSNNGGESSDDYLTTSGSRGFALIKDFNPAVSGTKKDTIELDGFAKHYRLVEVGWGQEFGRADDIERKNLPLVKDYALVYVGSNQNNRNDVIAVLQDLQPGVANKLVDSQGYLSNNSNVFKFLG